MTCLIDLAAIFQGNYSICRNKEELTDEQLAAQNDLMNSKSRFLEQLRHALRTQHYSSRTETASVHWIKRLVLYHHQRHPCAMAEFELTKAERVIVEINNMCGEKVTTLIDGNLGAGVHKLSWNAPAKPSGLYFCRFQTGQYAQTLKLILVKQNRVNARRTSKVRHT